MGTKERNEQVKRQLNVGLFRFNCFNFNKYRLPRQPRVVNIENISSHSVNPRRKYSTFIFMNVLSWTNNWLSVVDLFKNNWVCNSTLKHWCMQTQWLCLCSYVYVCLFHFVHVWHDIYVFKPCRASNYTSLTFSYLQPLLLLWKWKYCCCCCWNFWCFDR